MLDIVRCRYIIIGYTNLFQMNKKTALVLDALKD